jgi:hypothetical protein
VNTAVRRVLLVQGLYYVVTGVWPLLHLRSFEFVTGPKTDDWLVHMVGLLAAVAGAALLVAARGRSGGAVAWIVAIGTAAAFTAIDVVYTLRGVIRWVYMVDAAVQIVIVGALVVAYSELRRAH